MCFPMIVYHGVITEPLQLVSIFQELVFFFLLWIQQFFVLIYVPLKYLLLFKQ